MAEDAENRGQQDPPERAIVQLKLDTIELANFSGDLTEWEAFRDMFEYLVNKSNKLSDTVKFHQLRTHLKGEALSTISGYQFTGKNYQVAWADLKKRYDNEGAIANEYIRKFLNVPAITHKPTYESLSHIIDTCNQMLRALPPLGVQVSTWDPLVIFIIERKLDNNTRMNWRQERGVHYRYDTQALLNWLEERAIELHISSMGN